MAVLLGALHCVVHSALDFCVISDHCFPCCRQSASRRGWIADRNSLDVWNEHGSWACWDSGGLQEQWWKGRTEGYRSASYLGIGLAAAALIVGVVFVRMPKDQREGWGEEDNHQGMEMKGSEK